MLPASNSTTSASTINPADYPDFDAEPGVNYRHPLDDDGRLTGVPGTLLKHYLVGDDGSVWSDLKRGGKATTRWRKRRFGWEVGYPTILFSFDGRVKKWRMSRLVLTLFVGPCPPGMEACHKDDDPSNSRADNLEWGTHQDNVRQRDDRGRTAVGESYPHAKLKPSDIPRILELRNQGWYFREIGDLLGVCDEVVRKIVRGERWKHIPRHGQDDLRSPGEEITSPGGRTADCGAEVEG